MMSLEQLRASFQAQLAAWQATVQAFEVQMNLGKREAIDRLEQQKQLFAQGLDHLKLEVQRSRSIVESQREAFASAFDNLKLQFLLGRADTRDLFHEQEKAVHDAISKLDGEFNRHRDAFTDALGTEYVRWVDTVKAEFDAASAHFAEMRARQHANWEASRKAFEQNLESCRKQLEAAQQQAMAQAQQFPATLAAGMDHLRKSFSALFGGADNPKT